MTQITHLPADNILLIFDQLSFIDSFHFHETCKEYYKLFEYYSSTLKIEEIALIFQSTQNMSVFTREEIRKKLHIIKTNLYTKKQERQGEAKTFNVLNTVDVQSVSARRAVCVPNIEDTCHYKRSPIKYEGLRLDNQSTARYEINKVDSNIIWSIPIKKNHEGLKMLEISDTHWELQLNTINNIINLDADVKFITFKEISSHLDYHIYDDNFTSASGTISVSFPPHNISSSKFSHSLNINPLSENRVVRTVKKWNIPIATRTSSDMRKQVNTILKDNINEFSTTHGRYLINVGLVSEDKLNHRRPQHKNELLVYINGAHFWDKNSHLRFTGDAVTFTCFKRQLQDKGEELRASKMKWKINLRTKTENILLGIRDDLQIQFVGGQFVIFPINIITLDSTSSQASPIDLNYPYGKLYWYIFNLSSGEYFGCFNMQKNRFASNINPNSKINDWRIYQGGQIYLDGPNVFTVISDYLGEMTPATINSDGYVEPLLQKILAMPLNSFLSASKVDKCDEMLKNISSQLEYGIASNSSNNDNEDFIYFRKRNFEIKKIPIEQIKWNSIFEMTIGYGEVYQRLPPPSVNGDNPRFQFDLMYANTDNYKYFWNNKIVILSNFLFYRDEVAADVDHYSEVYMLICYDIEKNKHQYIKIEDVIENLLKNKDSDDLRAKDLFILIDDDLNYQILKGVK